MAKVGDVFKVFTNTITIKVAGADDGGMLAMFLEEVPPNWRADACTPRCHGNPVRLEGTFQDFNCG